MIISDTQASVGHLLTRAEFDASAFLGEVRCRGGSGALSIHRHKRTTMKMRVQNEDSRWADDVPGLDQLVLEARAWSQCESGRTAVVSISSGPERCEKVDFISNTYFDGL